MATKALTYNFVIGNSMARNIKLWGYAAYKESAVREQRLVKTPVLMTYSIRDLSMESVFSKPVLNLASVKHKEAAIKKSTTLAVIKAKKVAHLIKSSWVKSLIVYIILDTAAQKYVAAT